MSDVIEQMQKSKSFWYRDFFAKCELVRNNAALIKTVQSKGKNESFCFGGSNPNSREEVFETLKRVFPFLKEENFLKKFVEATNGGGHEWKRIARLHSSSLLPFLMFSQISDEHPLWIRIQNADLSCTNMRFAIAHFEIKNWLEKNDRHPSNIDVVLENEKAILFLESKFSEYVTDRTKSKKIPKKRYGKQFYKLTSNGNTVIRVEEGLITASDNTSHYLEGIKQIIAHYMGLEFAMRNGRYNHGGTEQHAGIPIRKRDVYLGEVVFDFGCIGRNSDELLRDYKDLYFKIASQLNHGHGSPKVLPDLLTYQMLFSDFDLERTVRDFYRFPNRPLKS